MPLKKCGEDGWKWGDSGKCYTGPSGKKQAIKQGIAIEGPKKFSEMAKSHEFPLTEGDIEYALECAYSQYNLSFSEGSMMSMALYSIDGWTEELTEDNFVVPTEYVESDCGCDEDCEDYDAASLWENIRKKKMREGDNYKPAKTEKEGRPSPEELKKAQGAECPAATKNVELNTKNRNATIKNHMYGPLNIDEPADYFEKLADKWDTSEEAAKKSLCGNCVAFDISSQMKECMPGEVSDDSGQLGYCWMHHFKCHSKRTCDTWAKGGPITKDKVSDDWAEKSKAEEAASYADHAEALQRGKPGPNDPRKTPAPKKDQKKGSKKNKPDSAKDDKGKITFSKSTIEKLSKAVREHNAKGKGPKATLGQLKAVYRRGAGAFSTSHAPKMSRDGWAMARVRAYLYLLRNGRPSNPNYKQDNDLLPSSHPRSSKASAGAGPMEDYIFISKEKAMEMAKKLGMKGVHSSKTADGKVFYFPGATEREFFDWYKKNDGADAAMTEKQKEALDKDKDGKITKKDFEMLRKSKGYGLPKDVVEKELKKEHADWHDGKEPDSKFKPKPTTLKDKENAEVKPIVDEKEKGPKHTSFVKKNQVTAPPTVTWQKAAEYKGRKVTLNKPFRTPSGPKKFAVYTKNESGNVVIVRFGDPNMKIKKNIPERRKSFRARHNCDNPGPKWKARYWSCRAW